MLTILLNWASLKWQSWQLRIRWNCGFANVTFGFFYALMQCLSLFVGPKWSRRICIAQVFWSSFKWSINCRKESRTWLHWEHKKCFIKRWWRSFLERLEFAILAKNVLARILHDDIYWQFFCGKRCNLNGSFSGVFFFFFFGKNIRCCIFHNFFFPKR